MKDNIIKFPSSSKNPKTYTTYKGEKINLSSDVEMRSVHNRLAKHFKEEEDWENSPKYINIKGLERYRGDVEDVVVMSIPISIFIMLAYFLSSRMYC